MPAPLPTDPLQRDWLGRGWAAPARVDPRTGGIASTAYEPDIREAILIILRTARGERLMHPDFGCGIHDLAFDVVDVSLLTRIESGVRDALLRYEARIEVLGVRADPLHAPDGVLLIELDYRVRRTNQIGNLVYPFYFREGGVATTNRGSRG